MCGRNTGLLFKRGTEIAEALETRFIRDFSQWSVYKRILPLGIGEGISALSGCSLRSNFAAVERPVFAMIVSLGRGLILIAASLLALPVLIGESGVWWAAGVSETVCLAGTVLLGLTYGRREKSLKRVCANAQ